MWWQSCVILSILGEMFRLMLVLRYQYFKSITPMYVLWIWDHQFSLRRSVTRWLLIILTIFPKYFGYHCLTTVETLVSMPNDNESLAWWTVRGTYCGYPFITYTFLKCFYVDPQSWRSRFHLSVRIYRSLGLVENMLLRVKYFNGGVYRTALLIRQN